MLLIITAFCWTLWTFSTNNFCSCFVVYDVMRTKKWSEEIIIIEEWKWKRKRNRTNLKNIS